MTAHAIYKIRCDATGKAYFGRTSSLDRRSREHFTALQAGKHKNQHLQNAFNKHGRCNFSFVVVESGLTEAAARDFEQTMLDNLWGYDALFNLTKCSGGGGAPGRVASAETRARMSAARRVYLADPEVRRRLSEKHTGKVLSAETRAKLSAARARTTARDAAAKAGATA